MEIDEHGQERDRRGEWRPGQPVTFEPLFDTPVQPMRILKYIFGFPGLINLRFLFFLAVTLIAYGFFTPEMTRMETFAPGWMLEILARNIVMMVLFAGSLHVWLYSKRMQGRLKKYNGKWLAKNDKRFLFNDQLWDNVFWSMTGVMWWTAYECVLWWGYANTLLPYIDFASNPIWFCVWLLLLNSWRNFHFYFIHRLLHWKPLYVRVHYLHHKNINVGPWSGLAMHPIEHLVYFSGMLIHLIIPSHPIHMMNNGIVLSLGTAFSHAGFDEIVFSDKLSLQNNRYLHYLHHRHVTVNYGESGVPLDKWFGSFHDGTPTGDARMREMMKAKIQKQTRKNTPA